MGVRSPQDHCGEDVLSRSLPFAPREKKILSVKRHGDKHTERATMCRCAGFVSARVGLALQPSSGSSLSCLMLLTRRRCLPRALARACSAVLFRYTACQAESGSLSQRWLMRSWWPRLGTSLQLRCNVAWCWAWHWTQSRQLACVAARWREKVDTAIWISE